MGKGQIVSGGTDGQYQVKLLYDRVKADRSLARINGWIALKNEKIAAIPVGDPEHKLPQLKLELASLQKHKEYLESIPSDPTITAWCADLSEELTGDVGTIEINGDVNQVLIRPGYDSASHNMTRDGQLQNIKAMTPEQWFYNAAMKPGWQKWMPTYRVGTITSIADDLCDVALDSAQASIVYGGNVSINESVFLSTVAIEYMDCNGSAFDEGDRVVVEFGEQDFDSPKVIGFEEHPKSCLEETAIIFGYGQDDLATFIAWDLAKNDYSNKVYWVDQDDEIHLLEKSDYPFKSNSEGYIGDENDEDNILRLWQKDRYLVGAPMFTKFPGDYANYGAPQVVLSPLTGLLNSVSPPVSGIAMQVITSPETMVPDGDCILDSGNENYIINEYCSGPTSVSYSGSYIEVSGGGDPPGIPEDSLCAVWAGGSSWWWYVIDFSYVMQILRSYTLHPVDSYIGLYGGDWEQSGNNEYLYHATVPRENEGIYTPVSSGPYKNQYENWNIISSVTVDSKLNPLGNVGYTYTIEQDTDGTMYSPTGDTDNITGEMAEFSDYHCVQFYTYRGHTRNTFAQCLKREKANSPFVVTRSTELETAIKDLINAIDPSGQSAILVEGKFYSNKQPDDLWRSINNFRQKNGMGQVDLYTPLASIATDRANYCTERGITEHVTGYLEDIHVGPDTENAKAIIDSLADSPLHKAVLLSNSTKVGFAVKNYDASIHSITYAAGVYDPITHEYSTTPVTVPIPTYLYGRMRFCSIIFE